MKIKSTNTILYCKKWEETVEFYRTGLKLLVLSSNEWFVEFKLNEMSRLSVANESRTSVDSSGGKGITVSLQVADIELAQVDLIEAGVTATPIKEVWERRQSMSMIPKEIDLSFGRGERRSNDCVKTGYNNCIQGVFGIDCILPGACELQGGSHTSTNRDQPGNLYFHFHSCCYAITGTISKPNF